MANIVTLPELMAEVKMTAKQRRQQIAQMTKRGRLHYKLYLKLVNRGVRFTNASPFTVRIGELTVVREDLPKVHRALKCPLVLSGTMAENPEENTIRVALKPKRFESFGLNYIRELKPTDKCRFETTTTTYTNLVCSR